MLDTIILGNGVAGMSAALYAKRANLNFKIIGEEAFSVGQIENAILVENYPGVKAIDGYSLGNSIREQLEDLGVEIEDKKVSEIKRVQSVIEPLDDHYEINYTNGETDYSKTVIYALGAKHRPLEDICKVGNEIGYHHCAICDGTLYKDKSVAIIGGGNSAFTEALYLSNIAKRVMIITDKVVADNIVQRQVFETENIDFFNDSKIESISKLENDIVISFNHHELKYNLGFDGLFVAIGTEPQSQYCPQGVAKTKFGYVCADETGYTGLDGFYVAGDVRYKTLRQAITAAADGVNCANSVVNYLRKIKE